MASLKVTLQKQNEYADGYPLIIRAFVGKKTIQFSMGVRLHPHQLRADGKVVKHNDAMEINKAITDSMRIIEGVLSDMDRAGRLETASTAEIKLAVSNIVNGVKAQPQETKTIELLDCYKELMKTKTVTSTYSAYQYSLKVIQEYCNSVGCDFPRFDDINHAWLLALQHYTLHIKKLKTNTSSVVFRCLKAVYNYAIANEYTMKYPFKKFPVTISQDSPTNPLTVEQIKSIRDLRIDRKNVELSRDVFMLEFYLCGINNIDLYNLKYDDKYVSYTRRKTGAKIKFLIPDEVRPYMEKYKDPKGERMFNFGVCESYFLHNINYNLKKALKGLGIESQYMYAARHSFATIGMQECDLSYSDIGQLLGHQEHSITSRYARPSEDKKNRNIRKILDTLL